MVEPRPSTTGEELPPGGSDGGEQSQLRARMAALAARQRVAEERLLVLVGPGARASLVLSSGDEGWWDTDLGTLFRLARTLRRDLAVLRAATPGSRIGVPPLSAQPGRYAA